MTEIIVREGWAMDESGLPAFAAASVEAVDQELAEIRSREGATKLMLAAVLTEASEQRFYGDGTLERVCKENQINYSTGKSMVAGYQRLRGVEIVERSTIVSAILSGELFWSKAEIAAAVEDDRAYVELMNEAADGALSASAMREKVRELREKEEVPDVEVIEEDPNAIRKIVRAGAMEYVVEFNDGTRHNVIRGVILEQGYKKCSCCEGFGVVERHQDQSKGK